MTLEWQQRQKLRLGAAQLHDHDRYGRDLRVIRRLRRDGTIQNIADDMRTRGGIGVGSGVGGVETEGSEHHVRSRRGDLVGFQSNRISPLPLASPNSTRRSSGSPFARHASSSSPAGFGHTRR